MSDSARATALGKWVNLTGAQQATIKEAGLDFEQELANIDNGSRSAGDYTRLGNQLDQYIAALPR